MQNLTTKIFEKNIECLKDSDLKNALINYCPKGSIKLENTNGYNLNYNGIYLHNTESPLGESQSIINSCANMKNSLTLILGLGLGYLFQLSFKNFAGKIILFEPDLEIIYTTFNYVDFSNELSSDRVLFTHNFDNFIKMIQTNLVYKESPIIISLKSYREINKNNFDSQIDAIKMIFGSNIVDSNFKTRNYYLMTKFLINNIPQLLTEAPLANYKNIYTEKTALIVGAGPSLDRNIEIIKENRDKFIIFTVGTALNSLLSNDIIPDFLSIIELYDCSTQIKNVDLSKVNYIIEPYSNPILHDVNAKRIFSHITNNNDINKFWAEISKTDISDYYSSGTVTFSAMDTARILGCSKILTIGLDLAFAKGKCYSKDSIYKDLVFDYDKDGKLKFVAKDFNSLANALGEGCSEEEKIRRANNRIDDLNKNLFYVKGITGEMLPTYKDYALFVQHFTQYSKMFSKDFKFINCSMTGAQIDGFENISLQEIVKTLPVIENKEIGESYNYDVKTIIKGLQDNISVIEYYFEVLQKNLDVIDKFIQQTLVNEAKVSFNNEENVAVNDIINLFRLLVTENKSTLFYCISMENKFDCIEKIKQTDFKDFHSVINMLNEIKTYYLICSEKILDIKNEITNTIEKLKEKI